MTRKTISPGTFYFNKRKISAFVLMFNKNKLFLRGELVI